MLAPADPGTQVRASAADPVRVLIAGAGVAGVTAAQLLRRAGLHPVLVERGAGGGDQGYMLALMPMVDPAIGRLGIREQYLDRSVDLRRYGLLTHTGRPLREDSLAGILARFGDYRGISRGELLDVLSERGGTVSYGTTVTRLREADDRVVATLRTGPEHIDAEFDLVIAADGMHSTTRGLVLGADQVETVDTGWGGWVVWTAPDADTDLGQELWGADFFVGSYPVRDRLGVFVGGPRSATSAGPARFAATMRRGLRTCEGRLDRVLDALERAGDPYFWPLTDCRAATWSSGRVVLLGDAAAGFLPTAGIGAGMAIESAWVLSETVRRATAGELPALLRSYERAQRPRVETAQNTSRKLARIMFRRSRALAVVRDLTMSVTSVELALGPIKKLLATAPRHARATSARL